MSRQPFWYDEALKLEAQSTGVATPVPLIGKLTADVVIVGGGFTGLWTAIALKQSQPALKVVILEQGQCGVGASGRNGGAMLTWSAKFPSLIKQYGLVEAINLVKSSEAAVSELAQFCQQHNIMADLRVDGAYYTATNSAQVGLMSAIADELAQQGINHWCSILPPELHLQTGSKAHIEGMYNPNAGSVHPGKLVRGLRQVALKLGVLLFENTQVTKLDLTQGMKGVKTCQGEVISPKVVVATNAWLPELLPEFKRKLVLVSSDMIITEKVPEALQRLGLSHGAATIDLRTFVHYYRTTSDGRIMLGKGGNRFAFANKVWPFFDKPSAYQSQLQAKLKWLFPDTHFPIERSWTGASDRSVSGMPFFGELSRCKGVFYGAGYSGNGVVQSYLGGQTLAAMILGNQGGLVGSALVNKPLLAFPVEPIRYMGANLVRQAIRGGEARADSGKSPLAWQQWLSRFAASAGKA